MKFRFRHTLYEIAEFEHKSLKNFSCFNDLQELYRIFVQVNVGSETPEAFAKNLIKARDNLLANTSSSKQSIYQGISHLNTDQVTVLHELKQRFFAYGQNDFGDGVTTFYVDRQKVTMIEELLGYVVNASLKLDSQSNSEQLAYIYKTLYEPIETKMIAAIEHDRNFDRRNPLNFREHRIKRAFDNDIMLNNRLEEIRNLQGYIVQHVLNGPVNSYTNMSIEYLLLNIDKAFTLLREKIVTLYNDEPTAENNPQLYAYLEYMDRIVERANIAFARRYDPTSQIANRVKVDLEKKNTKRALTNDPNVVIDSRLFAPEPSRFLASESQRAEVTLAKNNPTVELAEVFDLEYEGGLGVNSIADMMTMMMQSYDRGSEAKISNQPAVAAHFAATAQVFDPVANQYRDYVITANKGRFTGEEKIEKVTGLDGSKTDRYTRVLDEDGGQSFIVHFNEPLRHFDVEPISARYSGNNDVPDVHVSEIFSRSQTVSFVLSVNQVVMQRMNYIDIEEHLKNRFRNNTKTLSAELLAHEVRSEAYRRFHRSEMAPGAEVFDRSSKNIMVAATKITRDPKHLYFNIIAHFPDGVKVVENTDRMLLKVQEKLNQLVPKRDAFTIQVKNPIQNVENIPVENLTDVLSLYEKKKWGVKNNKKLQKQQKKITLKEERAKKLLIAEQWLKYIDDVINMAHLNNADSLEKSLKKFQKLLRQSVVNNPKSQKMLQKVYTMVYLSLNAMTSSNLLDKRKNFHGARTALAELNNMTEIYTKQDRALAVVMSTLVGIVFGTVLAVVLAATAVMPAAIVGALTVAGWVATMATPLGILGGGLVAYGIYGRRTERARREAINMQKSCVSILEDVKVKAAI